MNALLLVKESLRRMLGRMMAASNEMTERSLILQAQIAAQAMRRHEQIKGLHAVEFRAFSQWGEDGIIGWLVERLPDIPRSFIEFGVQDYRESNTRLLVQLRNWRGLVLDGSDEHVADIQRQDLYWRHDITAKCAFIDRDNINSLIKSAGFEGSLGLLSIDVDGNDYWIWDAIDTVDPAVVVCEYNAVLGDCHALVVPYRADFQRSVAHHSNLYFGASIRALVSLANRKGYEFVGTTSTGCNAFFVRKDLASSVVDALDNVWAFPSAVREARDAEGRLTFASGADRKAIIDRLPLIDVETSTETTLAACRQVYSPAWAEGRGIKWT